MVKSIYFIFLFIAGVYRTRLLLYRNCNPKNQEKSYQMTFQEGVHRVRLFSEFYSWPIFVYIVTRWTGLLGCSRILHLYRLSKRFERGGSGLNHGITGRPSSVYALGPQWLHILWFHSLGVGPYLVFLAILTRSIYTGRNLKYPARIELVYSEPYKTYWHQADKEWKENIRWESDSPD